MKPNLPNLGLGLGWRPELALLIERTPALGFIEVVAENISAQALPRPLVQLRERGVPIVPHGVSLSLGSAERPDSRRLARLAQLAEQLNAPFVSEHVAFVRAGGLESGHLLPVPRTRAMLDILSENIRWAQGQLPVPLVLENIATLFDWPDAELDEADFLAALLERTDALLLLDLANLYANARNLGWNARDYFARLPLDRLAYVHIAGGVERRGLYHDTHAHRIPAGVLQLLGELCGRLDPPGVLLERDDHFPPAEELTAELSAIAAVMTEGARRREVADVA